MQGSLLSYFFLFFFLLLLLFLFLFLSWLQEKIQAATVELDGGGPGTLASVMSPSSVKSASFNPFGEGQDAFGEERDVFGPLAGESSTDTLVDPPLSPPLSPPATDALDEAIRQFEEQYERLCKKTHKNQNGFEQEFQLLRMEDEQNFADDLCATGFKNRDKNRYKDILPIDSARVRLAVIEPNANDYINASYLKVSNYTERKEEEEEEEEEKEEEEKEEK